jgi:MtN3 and saliva related transmembrane protein
LVITESLGLAAGALATCSVIPQVVRIYRLKSAREISIVFTTMLILGLILWMVYGIFLELTPVIVWNSIGIGVVTSLMYAKFKYGR